MQQKKDSSNAKRLFDDESKLRAEILEATKLSNTKEGRILLAKLQARFVKLADDKRREANAAAGKTAAKQENKLKRAKQREEALKLAQIKKTEQENQGKAGRN